MAALASELRDATGILQVQLLRSGAPPHPTEVQRLRGNAPPLPTEEALQAALDRQHLRQLENQALPAGCARGAWTPPSALVASTDGYERQLGQGPMHNQDLVPPHCPSSTAMPSAAAWLPPPGTIPGVGALQLQGMAPMNPPFGAAPSSNG